MMAHHERYAEDGSATGEWCPRCGDALLANHGDRSHCGRCSYTEWH